MSYINAYNRKTDYDVIDSIRAAGYEVILSIGEAEENRIGSNCGQLVMRHLRANCQSEAAHGSYDYWKHVTVETQISPPVEGRRSEDLVEDLA